MIEAQWRAARALIGWSQGDLAQKIGASVLTIKRLETGSPSVSDDMKARAKDALESAGVEFTNGGQPGVRMKLMQTNFAIDAIMNAPPPLERTDDELLSDFLNRGLCVISVGRGRESAPSLREALAKATELERTGKRVGSILIPNQAYLGVDQIRRLLERLRNRPA